jgi:hypothetical protein
VRDKAAGRNTCWSILPTASSNAKSCLSGLYSKCVPATFRRRRNSLWNTIRCFIVTMPYLVARSGKAKGLYSGMRLKGSLIDQEVISFEFESKTIRWWSS